MKMRNLRESGAIFPIRNTFQNRRRDDLFDTSSRPPVDPEQAIAKRSTGGQALTLGGGRRNRLLVLDVQRLLLVSGDAM